MSLQVSAMMLVSMELIFSFDISSHILRHRYGLVEVSYHIYCFSVALFTQA